MAKNFYVFTDGSSRGNPGPACAAFIVKNEKGEVLVKKRKLLGITTNNVAEYTAVLEALKWIKENLFSLYVHGASLQFFLDSQLVVNQLNGSFKIRSKNLRNLILEIRKLEQEIGVKIFYHFIPREKNFQAHFLVKF